MSYRFMDNSFSRRGRSDRLLANFPANVRTDIRLRPLHISSREAFQRSYSRANNARKISSFVEK